MTTKVGLAAVDAYMDAIPESSEILTIEKVEWGEAEDALWIVTSVRTGANLRALEPLYRAEMAAHDAGEAEGEPPLIFRILELDLGERLYEGPRVLHTAIP